MLPLWYAETGYSSATVLLCVHLGLNISTNVRMVTPSAVGHFQVRHSDCGIVCDSVIRSIIILFV